MELQFRKTACRCLARAARAYQTQELTQELRLTDGMPDIGRVLSSWGQMILRSKEWRADTITVSGGVMVWVLYAPEDGTEPRCIDGWIPFQMRWDLSDPGREGPVRIGPMLRFVDSRTVSARKFMVRVGAAVLAEALYPTEFHVHSPEELPEDIEVLRRTYPVRLPKEAGEKTFLLDEDLTIPGMNSQPEKILSYTIQPEVSDSRVMSDKVVIRGTGNLHLVYCCREGRIRTSDFEIPFSQFAELEHAYSPDARADVRMGTTSLELDLNEEGQLRIKCGLVAQYLVDDRELMELTEDAYSPRRQVTIQTEPLVLPSILEDRRENLTAAQTLTGHTGERADVTFFPDFPRQRQTAEGVEIEIPGLFQVLYYGEDGNLQTANARWDGTMTLPAGENSRIDAFIQPVGRPHVVTGPEGMELSSPIQMDISTTTDQGLPMVTGLEVGEMPEPDSNRPSLILCRPGSEGIWNLAKRCGSTVGAIQRANDLQEEPAADRILLIPVS